MFHELGCCCECLERLGAEGHDCTSICEEAINTLAKKSVHSLEPSHLSSDLNKFSELNTLCLNSHPYLAQQTFSS